MSLRSIVRALRERRDPTLDMMPFLATLEDIDQQERSRTELHRIFYGHRGTLVHKWRHYLDIYDRHLSHLRGKPIHVLEIGVSRGGSLAMWREYFGPSAILFGIDVDERCRQFNGQHAEVRIGSQNDPDFLRQVAREMGRIDVVIDDGSHVADHQKVSFETLFPLLNMEGIYICEDLHTAYWAFFNGGYLKKTSFIERAKQLIDDIHGDFHSKGQTLADAHRLIAGLHFYNSMLVIEKAPQAPPRHIEIGEQVFEG